MHLLLQEVLFITLAVVGDLLLVVGLLLVTEGTAAEVTGLTVVEHQRQQQVLQTQVEVGVVIGMEAFQQLAALV